MPNDRGLDLPEQWVPGDLTPTGRFKTAPALQSIPQSIDRTANIDPNPESGALAEAALSLLSGVLSFDRPVPCSTMVQEAGNILLIAGHPTVNDFRDKGSVSTDWRLALNREVLSKS